MSKLRQKNGETLTETLCAVLVAGIAVALLAGFISASSRLNQSASGKMAELVQAVSQAETAGNALGDGVLTVEVDGVEVQLPVSFYGKSEWAVAYRENGGAGP